MIIWRATALQNRPSFRLYRPVSISPQHGSPKDPEDPKDPGDPNDPKDSKDLKHPKDPNKTIPGDEKLPPTPIPTVVAYLFAPLHFNPPLPATTPIVAFSGGENDRSE